MTNTMAPRRKPGRPPKGDKPLRRDKSRHTKPRKAFHAPQPLFDALADFCQSQRPAIDEAAAFRTALEDFLVARGYWPRKPPKPGE